MTSDRKNAARIRAILAAPDQLLLDTQVTDLIRMWSASGREDWSVTGRGGGRFQHETAPGLSRDESLALLGQLLRRFGDASYVLLAGHPGGNVAVLGRMDQMLRAAGALLQHDEVGTVVSLRTHASVVFDADEDGVFTMTSWGAMTPLLKDLAR